MKIQKMYKYLGTNGILTTPIHLEGIYCVQLLQLTSDEGKRLTKDNKNFVNYTIIPAEDLEEWKEV